MVGNKTIGSLLSDKVKQEMDQELGFLDRKIRSQIMNRIFKESGFQSLTQLTKGLPIEIKSQISEFVTKKSPAIIYEALRPIEMAIYDFSLELLKGLQSAYILNSEAETERLSSELKQAVEAIRDYRGERYEDAHAILVKQLEKLKQHEDAITTPLEGFVFQVGDQMYKFTGSFAPANQLLGLFKWGRGKIPPIKVDLSAEEEKLDELVIKEHEEKHKLALIPGGFKPPHRGHLEMVKHYLREVGENGKVLLFIGSGGKNPRCCGDRPITFEDSERIWEIYFANENILYPSPNLEIHQIEGKGPIGTVVDIVKDQVDPETTEVYLGVGEEDTERWDFMIGNEKYNPKNVSIHTKAFPDQADAEGNRLRASNMRKAAEEGNKELFQSFLPQNSLIATDDILELLGVKIRDEQDKIEEAAHIPMGIFLGLVEEVVEEAWFGKKKLAPEELVDAHTKEIIKLLVVARVRRSRDEYVLQPHMRTWAETGILNSRLGPDKVKMLGELYFKTYVFTGRPRWGRARVGSSGITTVSRNKKPDWQTSPGSSDRPIDVYHAIGSGAGHDKNEILTGRRSPIQNYHSQKTKKEQYWDEFGGWPEKGEGEYQGWYNMLKWREDKKEKAQAAWSNTDRVRNRRRGRNLGASMER